MVSSNSSSNATHILVKEALQLLEMHPPVFFWPIEHQTYLFACACRTTELDVAASGATTAGALLPLHSACLSQGVRPIILLLYERGSELQLR